MPAERHEVLDGRVLVYRRENSRRWQCAATLSGKHHRSTTGHTNLAFAVAFAEDWYIERRADDRLLRRGFPLPDLTVRAAVDEVAPQTAKHRRKPASEPQLPLFDAAADAFYAEYKVITAGERNAEYVAHKEGQLRLYLRPFFGKTAVSDITAGMVAT